MSALLLALVLSLDSFTVGALYGIRRLRLSGAALILMCLTTMVVLGLAMLLGQAAAALLPEPRARQAGGVLLVGVGLWALVSAWRRPGSLPVSLGTGAGEAILLGLALSLDAIASSIGAVLTGVSPWLLCPAVGGMGLLCFQAGYRAALWAGWPGSGRWSHLHGLALILYGLYRFWG